MKFWFIFRLTGTYVNRAHCKQSKCVIESESDFYAWMKHSCKYRDHVPWLPVTKVEWMSNVIFVSIACWLGYLECRCLLQLKVGQNFSDVKNWDILKWMLLPRRDTGNILHFAICWFLQLYIVTVLLHVILHSPILDTYISPVDGWSACHTLIGVKYIYFNTYTGKSFF